MTGKNTTKLSTRIIAVLMCVLMLPASVGMTARAAAAMDDNEADGELTAFTDAVVETENEATALFAEDGTGLCEHHPEHTEECGYSEGLGHICTHEHDEFCGYREWSPEVPCDKNCTAVDDEGNIIHVEDCAYEPEVLPSPCTHEHDWACGFVPASFCQHAHNETCGYSEAAPCDHEHNEDCGYVEGAEATPCVHVHDETCGYAEAVEGQPCVHVHDEVCGYSEGSDEIPCDRACVDVDEDGIIDHVEDCAYTPAAEAAPCAHEHNEECGYAEAVEGAPCAHEHDESCGYTEAVEGAPCEHEHDDECGYAEEAPCLHEHDDSCGYMDPVEETPCEFVCEICAFTVTDWTWVDPYEILLPGEDYGVEDVAWVLAAPGLEEDDLTELLPAAVTVMLKNGEQIELPITWDLDNKQAYEMPTQQPEDGEDEYVLSAEEAEAEAAEDEVQSVFYLITAQLPEEYTLDENAPALTVLVQMTESVSTMALATAASANGEIAPGELHFIVRHWHTRKDDSGSMFGDGDGTTMDSSNGRHFVVVEGYIIPPALSGTGRYEFDVLNPDGIRVRIHNESSDAVMEDDYAIDDSNYIDELDHKYGTIVFSTYSLPDDVENFSSYSVSAGHDAVTTNGADFTIKYKENVHLVKAHAFYVSSTVDTENGMDDVVLGELGLELNAEHDTAMVYMDEDGEYVTYPSGNDGGDDGDDTKGKIITLADVTVANRIADGSASEADKAEFAAKFGSSENTVAEAVIYAAEAASDQVKLYNSGEGLHTDKTATESALAGLFDNDGRTFDIELEAWHSEGLAQQIGLVLDASGSMAFASDAPTAIKVTDFDKSVQDALQDRRVTAGTGFTVKDDFMKSLVGYYEFWPSHNADSSGNGNTQGNYRTWYLNSAAENRKSFNNAESFEADGVDAKFAKMVAQATVGSSIDFSNQVTVKQYSDAQPLADHDVTGWGTVPANFDRNWGFNLTTSTTATAGNSGFLLESASGLKGDDFTISFSLQQRDGNACSSPIEILYIGPMQTSGTDYFHVYRDGTDIIATCGSTTVARITNAFTGKATHNISFVFGKDGMTTYWDGAAYGSSVSISGLNPEAVVFAPFKDDNNQTQYFTVDNICLFQKALSEVQINALLPVVGEEIETVQAVDSFDAFLTPGELALLMDPHKTDNSLLGWAGYNYFVYNPVSTTTAYVSLGYYRESDGFKFAAESNKGGEGWYYISGTNWTNFTSNGSTAKALYGLATDSYKDTIKKATSLSDTVGNGGAAPDVDSDEGTGSIYTNNTAGPIKFYIDEAGYLRCFFATSNTRLTSYVYMLEDGDYIRTEALQRALGLFVTELSELSPGARVSAVRFSGSTDAYDQLLLLDWTEKPSDSTGMLSLGQDNSTTYKYALTGGTNTATGLKAYIDQLQPSDNPYLDMGITDEQPPKYLIIFTDGADDNVRDASNTAIGLADNLKEAGYTIFTVLLDGGSMNQTDYDAAETFLTRLAGKEEYNKDENGVATEGPENYFYSVQKARDAGYKGNDADVLTQMFVDEVLIQIVDPLLGYTVQDYIDPRFDLVDADGIIWHLRADGEVVVNEGTAEETSKVVGENSTVTITISKKSDEDAQNPYLRYDGARDLYYLVWEDQTIPGSTVGANRLPVWNATVTVRAKEFFLGGNAVLTNGNEAGMNLVYDPQILSGEAATPDNLAAYSGTNYAKHEDAPAKGFPRVSVNVTPPYEDAELTQTIFMGETLNATEIAQELLQVAEDDAEGTTAQYIWEYPTRFMWFFNQYDLEESKNYEVTYPDVTPEPETEGEAAEKGLHKPIAGEHITLFGEASQINRLVETLHTVNRKGEYLNPVDPDSEIDGHIRIISNRIYDLIKGGERDVPALVSTLSEWLIDDRSYVYLPYIYLPDPLEEPTNSTGNSDANLGDVLGYLHFEVLEQFMGDDGTEYPAYPEDGVTQDTLTRKSQLTMWYKVRNPHDRRNWNNSQVLQERNDEGENIYGRDTDYKPAVGTSIDNDIGVKVAQETKIVSGQVQLQVKLAKAPDTALIGETITYTADVMQGSTKVGTLEVNATVEAGKTLYSAKFTPEASFKYEGTYWGLPIGSYTLANGVGTAPEGYCFRALTPAEESAYSEGEFPVGTDCDRAQDFIAYIDGSGTVTLGYKDPTAKAAEEGDDKQSSTERAYTDYRFALFQVVLEAAGDLEISKTVYGAEDHKNVDFTFTVTLTDENGDPLTGAYDYYTYDPLTGDVAVEKLGTVSNNGSVTLRDGQSVIIKDLPAGAKYTITETAPTTGYVTEQTACDDEELTDGKIEAGKTDQADFVNYAVHSLTVSKTVMGAIGLAQDKTWTFNVELVLPDWAVESGFDLPSAPELTAVDGKANTYSATFTLENGESIELDGLPCETVYTVTEVGANENGYKTTVNGNTSNGTEQGDLTRDTTLAYINRNPASGVVISKTVISPATADKSKEFEFTVTVTPPQGTTDWESTKAFEYTKSGEAGTRTLTLEANGDGTWSGTVTLTHGQEIHIEEIPVNAIVSVAETPVTSFATKTDITKTIYALGSDPVTDPIEDSAVTVETGDIIYTFAFTNTRGTADLEIEKEVVGPVDPNAEFTFTVKLEQLAVNGEGDPIPGQYVPMPEDKSFHAYIHMADHTVEETSQNGAGETVTTQRPCTDADHPHGGDGHIDLTPDGDGTVAITLKAGQICVILDLPEGARYTVEEVFATADEGDRYVTTVTVDGKQTASDNRTVTGTVYAVEKSAVRVTYVNNRLVDMPGTGGSAVRMWPYELTGLALLLAAAGVNYRKKKKSRTA